MVGMRPVLNVNLMSTDPFTKTLLPLWNTSGFNSCSLTKIKVTSVQELSSRREVPISEYKLVFDLKDDGTLSVFGFMSQIKNWTITISALGNSTTALALAGYAVDLTITATTPIPNQAPFFTDPPPATFNLPDITPTSGVVLL